MRRIRSLCARMKCVMSLLNVSNLGFPCGQDELDYKQSKELSFFWPSTIAAAALAVINIPPFMGHVLRAPIHAHEWVPLVSSGVNVCNAFALLLVSCMKRCFGSLKFLDTEAFLIVISCVVIVTTCFGNQYFVLKVLGAEILQEDMDHGCRLMIGLCCVIAFVYQILSVRIYFAFIVLALSVVSFCLQLAIAGDPLPGSVPDIISCGAFLHFTIVRGAYRHEKRDREKWLAERKVRQLTLLAKGVDTDALAVEEIKERSRLTLGILDQLPKGLRVCILGSTTFNNAETELLVKGLGERFGKKLSQGVVFLTGGMPGVQKVFAQTLGAMPCTQVHLLPEGVSSDFGVGSDLTCGHDLPERMQVFASIGHVYITIEGGPGVAKEAKQAFERGALVLPIKSTGGASAGMFDFPSAAFDKPDVVKEEDWLLLNAAQTPDATAAALVDVISDLAVRHSVSNPNIRESTSAVSSTQSRQSKLRVSL